MKDYYKILGVEENASDEDIKKQYRKLSKEYHPDLNPQGAETFKEIAEAYENIGSTSKRAEYDNRRKNPFNGNNLDDLFNSMFSGGNPFRQQQRKSAPDKIIKLAITIQESFLSSEKNITYLRNGACNTCKGSGGEQQRCNTCGGLGFQLKTFGTGFMVQQIRTNCETCGGRGYTLIHKCYYCDGRGVKAESHQINIKIPHGIDDGQFIKLKSLGDFNQGEYGDLVLQIQILPDESWQKMGNDLVYKVFLDYEDLKRPNYLIPHFHGELSVTAPKIFDTSKPLRVRGKGFNNGDLYINLFVRFDRTMVTNE
jgi:molecular chaperone DnaJ